MPETIIKQSDRFKWPRGTPPFLKWAGGKRWLMEKHYDVFNIDYNALVEPFLGSGAVFFGLNPHKAILSDSNEALINTYIALRDDWRRVEHFLTQHHKKHCKDYYYEIRSKKPRCKYRKAARFIYLNRTCWNGLYRVNKKGKFNVPIGTKNNAILDTDNFEETSKILEGKEIHCRDFEETINSAKENDLIFADPPYTINHNKNGFIKYNEKIFSWDDQKRLKNSLDRAKTRGCRIIILNADHESIHELYSDEWKILRLERNSIISGSQKGRGKYGEVVIRC
jgi:DNA adenine methylase